MKLASLLLTLVLAAVGLAQPNCVDQRLQISLFTEAPNIVQPVSAIFDSKGRLLVIENHTHFRPDDYKGPTTDRILIVKDTDGDGVADSHDVFYEGERDSMDLALHADGSVYLATRRKVVRLVDTDDDGVVDKTAEIVRLETDGNYPHNGLSGLVFDLDGKLQFGFGENLGKSYTLIGSDGAKLEGGAEGGSTYRCNSDGSKLERVATGFWNPFGQCMDVFGNIFAVDNDPDATPPCRLLHVTEGANFGCQFRYGRPGNHPLQTWTGELPGTIGMVAGTGEAPCEVVYCMPNSGANITAGLPEDYVGDLLVASWGDHRIERYRLQRKGASFEATRSIIVQGGTDFWPVGLAFAPDGSLFVTDWGSRSYPLHGEGKVWRLSSSQDQPVAKKKKATGRKKEIQQALRMRDSSTTANELRQIANSAQTMRLRALAVRLLGSRNEDVSDFANEQRSLPIRREVLRSLSSLTANQESTTVLVESGLRSDDATLRSLAVGALVRNQESMPKRWFENEFLASHAKDDSAIATGVALALEVLDVDWRSSIDGMLKSNNEDVRFVAARWAADRNLKEHVPAIASAIEMRSSLRTLLGLVAARQHLLGQKLNQNSLTTVLQAMLQDDQQPASTKVLALRAASTGTLTMDTLANALKDANSNVQREAIYLMQGDERSDVKSTLLQVVDNASLAPELRADAMVAFYGTTSLNDAKSVSRLLEFAGHESPNLRHTSAQLLTGARLTDAQRDSLQNLAGKYDGDSVGLRIVERVLNGHPPRTEAKSSEDSRSVEERLQVLRSGDLAGNAVRGRRVFQNTRLVQCAKCHQVGNRGQNIGPELTGIAKTQSNEQLLRSIIHPSERIAPQYQPWVIVDKNGRAKTGYHLASERLVETFVQSNGEPFKIAQDDIEERIAGKQSIMPTGLVDHLTSQELNDLLAYLAE